ncbi:membrane protein DedA, SNARE-associated domain [Thermoactinomyces sp. DSM 45891]|uniref:DedA family protein n=1 Tax=Thermoactinomyces sp. DSM 45891 TaxID=1761907 RepID=UPI00091CB041|nr:DedA family protein [Thermoactinomyces sp. DSM 45891]SFX19215.1 membrane protein DedA, SNARE-associated domain [Thermoactinomyces sp. DSM 45891]
MTEIIHSFLEWLSGLGYFGIALGLMVEVIPSEIVLAYGGYLISIGKVEPIGALLAGVIGGVLAQLFLYWAGYYGGRPLIEKYGKYVLIKPSHLDLAERWFEKYGSGVIFGARFIPVVRHAISIPAGIAKMSWKRFTILTTLAAIPWSVFFLYLGYKIGDNQEKIKEVAGPYIQMAMIAIAILLGLYFGIKWFINKRRKTN